MKRRSLKLSDLQRISQMLQMGLRTGRDIVSILRWISENDAEPRVREVLGTILKKSQFEPLQFVLSAEKGEATEIFEKVFIEILLQSQRGSAQLSKLFENFSGILRRVQKLERQSRSLLFVPRFQSYVSFAIAFLFAAIFPMIWPDLFPSFWHLGKPDLFCAGLATAAFGVWVLQILCRRPQRRFQCLLQSTFFFQFLSIFTQCGFDFMSSWARSLEAVPFSKDLRLVLSVESSKVQNLQDFLIEKTALVPKNWENLMTGLVWISASGIGLSNYLQQSADAHTEDIAFEWEDEIRKLSVLSLLPLSFIVFPASLFLLIGPRLMELMSL